MAERESLPVRLRSKRLEGGLTQRDLAKLIDVPRSTLSRVEGGFYVPNPGTRAKIEAWLGVAVGVRQCCPVCGADLDIRVNVTARATDG